MIHKSVVIVGGGPIGLISAIRLALIGFTNITILDAPGNFSNNTKPQDGRVLALSYASYKSLEDLGVWERNLATPIKQVHISHSGLGISKIEAEDVGIPELGYTIKYVDLFNNLQELAAKYPAIRQESVLVNQVIPGKNYATIMYGDEGNCLTADLVLLAEGGKIKLSQVEYREYDYDQIAVIATLKTQLKHNNIAFERFDDKGALVLLPHGSSFVLVWSCKKSDKENLQNKDYLFEQLSQLNFVKRLGKFELIDNIHTFDLKLRVAKNRVLDRVVLLGSSAQIVHPVSAQGLNLGLRDVNDLLSLLDGNDINTNILNLGDYDKLRKADTKFVIGFTHFLAKFLERPGIRHLRGIGLFALSNFKPLQNKLANSLIFGN